MNNNDVKLLEFDRADWVRHATCRGMAASLFFGGRGETTHEAKAVCAVCPVRQECLHHAIDVGEKFGIWGGLSERERRRIRRVRTVGVAS